MKRLLSLFLVALVVISLLSIMPVAAVNGDGLWYDKTGNNVKITVKGIESSSAILLVGKYQNKKMISSGNYPITNHNGTYALPNITMDQGFEYRFYLWEDLSNFKPLFESLSLSTETDDGVGSTEDNGVKSVTIKENLDMGWYSSGVYSHCPDDKALKATEYELVTSGLTVVYNNSVITNEDIEYTFGSLDELVRQADVLTLIGYGTAPYSEIHITDYTYKVVDWVDVEKKIIKFKQEGFLELDGARRGNANFTYNLYDEVGNIIKLSDVKEYDVFNMPVAYDQDITTVNHLDIYITREFIEGQVTAKRNGKYIISDKEYEYLAEAQIRMLDKGKFFLTINGKIAWKHIDLDIGELGLLTEIKPETEETSTRYTLTLFTQAGSIDLPVAESIEFIDDSNLSHTYTTLSNGQDELFGVGSVFANALTDAKTEEEAQEKINKKFIAYKLNTDRQISSIRISNSSWKEPFFAESMQGEVYDVAKNRFGGLSTKDSALFYAPIVEKNSGWNIDISNLTVVDFSDLKDKSTYTTYNGNTFIKAVGYQEELCAVVLTKETTCQESTAEHLSVAKEVGATIDENDNLVGCVTFIENGEEHFLRENFEAGALTKAGLGKGDIFIYETDEQGDITEVTIIYDSSSRTLSDYAQSMSLDDDETAFVFGVVTRFDGDKIEIASNVDETSGEALTSRRFRIHHELMDTYANCTFCDDRYPFSCYVTSKSIYNSIKATEKEDRVYTVVAKLDDCKRVCDIVTIRFSSNIFKKWKDINNFTNWKLTY